MAYGQHKLSRRALLGGVCAAPVLSHSRNPGLDPGSMNAVGGEPDAAVFMDSGFRRNDGEGRDDEWGMALARLREAQAVLESARSEPDEDAYDALLDSHTDALTALLALPASDLPALAAKSCPERSRRIDAIVPNLARELTGSEDCLERLRQDAHRLAATAA
jgi:hypothetical protein